VIEKLGSRQRIAVIQIRIAFNRPLPFKQQGLTATIEVIRQGKEFPMYVLQCFSTPGKKRGGKA
jgi:hypothetical protein